MRTYNNLGISEAFHPLSHHGNSPDKQARLVTIQNYHTKMFAGFIERLASSQEGDGTVLDHSTILYGSNMSDSNRHNNDPLPVAVLGRAHGRIKGGQHLRYPQDSRFRPSRDAIRASADPGAIDWRQWRDPLGGLTMTAKFAVLVIAWSACASALATEGTLLDAVESKDRAAALKLLAAGSNAQERGADGTTALMWAAHHGDLELVQRLIRAGADVAAVNEFGTSALLEAAAIGSEPVVEALLDAGADANSANPEGETPLMVVARTGNVKAASALIAAGAEVNTRELWGGQSALMWAAAQSQPQMVKLLVANGADVDARGVIRNWQRKVIAEPRPKDMNRGGFTALLYAAARRMHRLREASARGRCGPQPCRP